MPLGTEVGLGPGDTVLDGDPATPPPKGNSSYPNLWPMPVVTKLATATTSSFHHATLCYRGMACVCHRTLRLLVSLSQVGVCSIKTAKRGITKKTARGRLRTVVF